MTGVATNLHASAYVYIVSLWHGCDDVIMMYSYSVSNRLLSTLHVPPQEPVADRPSSPPPLPPPPVPQQGLQIRKDYNPKVARPPAPPTQPPQQFLISPITGEKIPAEKMQEHMRYGELHVHILPFSLYQNPHLGILVLCPAPH